MADVDVGRTVRPRRLRTPSYASLALPPSSPPLLDRADSGDTERTAATDIPNVSLSPPPSPHGPARRRAAADRAARRRAPAPARPRGPPPGVDKVAAAAARADAAARSATAAWADAHAKARRAAALVAAAVPVPASVEAGLRKQRRVAGYGSPPSLGGSEHGVRPARGHPLVGARVSVFSAADGAFFRATVRDVGAGMGTHSTALLRYDDGKAEVADLAARRFRLLTPRAASAGCGAGLLAAALALGAEGVRLDAEAEAAPPGAGPPAGPECARRGAALLLRSPSSDAGWTRADVVGLAPAARRVRVLYADGEDEWVDLEAEARRGAARVALGAPPLGAGLPPGLAPPAGPAAVGWRVAPYFDADGAFYAATVVGYDGASREHALAYDGGGAERVALDADVVKWLSPPAPGTYLPPPPCQATGPFTMTSAPVPVPAAPPAAPPPVAAAAIDPWCAAAAADVGTALPLGPDDVGGVDDDAGLAALFWPTAGDARMEDAAQHDCAATNAAVAALKIASDGGGDAVSGCSTASGAPATPRSTLRSALASSPELTSPETTHHGATAALAALLPASAAASLAGGRMHGGAPAGFDAAVSVFGDALCPLGLADALGW